MKKYTNEHEVLFVEGSDIALVGITEYAQDALGDIVFVELPSVGKKVSKGEDFAVVESVKTAAEVYSPVTGEITAINDNLGDDPEALKKPLEEGWIAKIKMTELTEIDGLMDEAAYKNYCKGLD